MQFSCEIDDQFVPAIEKFLSTQRRVESDPATGAQSVVNIHEDVEDFLCHTLMQTIEQIVAQFPTEAMREHMIAQKQIRDAMQYQMRPAALNPATGQYERRKGNKPLAVPALLQKSVPQTVVPPSPAPEGTEPAPGA